MGKKNKKPAVKPKIIAKAPVKKPPTFDQSLGQLTQLKVEEQAILKRGLQTFLGSLDNVIQIDNRLISLYQTELKKKTESKKKNE